MKTFLELYLQGQDPSEVSVPMYLVRDRALMFSRPTQFVLVHNQASSVVYLVCPFDTGETYSGELIPLRSRGRPDRTVQYLLACGLTLMEDE